MPGFLGAFSAQSPASVPSRHGLWCQRHTCGADIRRRAERERVPEERPRRRRRGVRVGPRNRLVGVDDVAYARHSDVEIGIAFVKDIPGARQDHGELLAGGDSDVA